MSNTPQQSREKNELGLVGKNPPVAGLVAPRNRPRRNGKIPPRRARRPKYRQMRKLEMPPTNVSSESESEIPVENAGLIGVQPS